MLMGYKAGWLQATPGLRKGLMIAMGGIMIFYGVVWIASMFGIHPPGFINGGGPLGSPLVYLWLVSLPCP